MEKENPIGVRSANRVPKIIACHSIDVLNPNENRRDFQASLIIADRYRLSPLRARIVCALAGIGGDA